MNNETMWSSPDTYNLLSKKIQKKNSDILINISLENVKKKESIVDLGCGTGYLLKKMVSKKEFEKYVGVDISKNMLNFSKNQLTKKKSPIDFILGDFMKIDFYEKYSLTISNSAFHWFDNDKKRSLKKIIDITKPGGIISISTAGKNEEIKKFDSIITQALCGSSENPFTKKRISSKKLEGIAITEGLKIIDLFTLTRNFNINTKEYAEWLYSSGFITSELSENMPTSIVDVTDRLTKNIGDFINFLHCSTFGVFKKIN